MREQEIQLKLIGKDLKNLDFLKTFDIVTELDFALEKTKRVILKNDEQRFKSLFLISEASFLLKFINNLTQCTFLPCDNLQELLITVLCEMVNVTRLLEGLYTNDK